MYDLNSLYALTIPLGPVNALLILSLARIQRKQTHGTYSFSCDAGVIGDTIRIDANKQKKHFQQLKKEGLLDYREPIWDRGNDSWSIEVYVEAVDKMIEVSLENTSTWKLLSREGD